MMPPTIVPAGAGTTSMITSASTRPRATILSPMISTPFLSSHLQQQAVVAGLLASLFSSGRNSASATPHVPPLGPMARAIGRSGVVLGSNAQTRATNATQAQVGHSAGAIRAVPVRTCSISGEQSKFSAARMLMNSRQARGNFYVPTAKATKTLGRGPLRAP
jgi:hypothetical protein